MVSLWYFVLDKTHLLWFVAVAAAVTVAAVAVGVVVAFLISSYLVVYEVLEAELL